MFSDDEKLDLLGALRFFTIIGVWAWFCFLLLFFLGSFYSGSPGPTAEDWYLLYIPFLLALPIMVIALFFAKRYKDRDINTALRIIKAPYIYGIAVAIYATVINMNLVEIFL